MTFQTRNIKTIFFTGDDATAPQTHSQVFCSSYAWSLKVILTNVNDGTPTITLNGRNSDTEPWKPYKECAKDVEFEDGAVCFIDEMIPYLQLQLDYKPGGATTGTIDAEMTSKPLA